MAPVSIISLPSQCCCPQSHSPESGVSVRTMKIPGRLTSPREAGRGGKEQTFCRSAAASFISVWSRVYTAFAEFPTLLTPMVGEGMNALSKHKWRKCKLALLYASKNQMMLVSLFVLHLCVRRVRSRPSMVRVLMGMCWSSGTMQTRTRAQTRSRSQRL